MRDFESLFPKFEGLFSNIKIGIRMASFDYNPIADKLKLNFPCPECGSMVEDCVNVPSPDFSAETHLDSINSDYDVITCPHCGHEYEVNLNTGFYEGYGEIEEVEEGHLGVEEHFPEEDDDEYYEQQLYEATHTDIERAMDSIAGLGENVKQFLYRLLYANVITSMETFLGDTLKREVLKDEDSLRRFVETYKPFNNISLSISDLYMKKDSMPAFVKNTLCELLYHDLRKIKPIYKAALGIDLGDVSELYKAVLTRHDLVHRNGKNHEGQEHIITERMVRELQDKVKTLMDNVNKQLAEIYAEGLDEGEET